jgi:hypothetical protein
VSTSIYQVAVGLLHVPVVVIIIVAIIASSAQNLPLSLAHNEIRGANFRDISL